MSKLFLLFSHTLSTEQREDARRSFGITEDVRLPEDLQVCWSNVPPELASIETHIRPILDWLEAQAHAGDYVLAQGDFGATYLAVTHAMQHGLIPVYSTTQRQAVEQPQPDGTVQVQRVFKHVRFRKYQDIKI